jgi:hypothetical protein
MLLNVKPDRVLRPNRINVSCIYSFTKQFMGRLELGSTPARAAPPLLKCSASAHASADGSIDSIIILFYLRCSSNLGNIELLQLSRVRR